MITKDREFAFTFAFVFLLLAFIEPSPLIFLSMSLVLVLLGLIKPQALSIPRSLWSKFGELISRITNPVILGLLFFLVLSPMAFFRRSLGRAPMSFDQFEKLKSSRSLWQPVSSSNDFKKMY